MKPIFCSLFSIFLATCALSQQERTVNVRVTVTEEDGTAIENANVEIMFVGRNSRHKSPTNSDGVVSASGKTNLYVHVNVDKEGYYPTYLRPSVRLSRTKDHDVTYVLRKIKKPIPLYAKRFQGKIPGLGSPYGFDFKVGDWVAPHGSGETPDVNFTATVIESKGELAGKLEVTFPNDQEGFLKIDDSNGYLPLSKMVMPNAAPDAGYKPTFGRIESGNSNENKPSRTSYFFRTRVQTTPDGEKVFNYSKLRDGIRFRASGGRLYLNRFGDLIPKGKEIPEEHGMIEFTYYFNPTPGDRNLECDTRKHLLKVEKTGEFVREP